jgi:signal transduction histidine kinase
MSKSNFMETRTRRFSFRGLSIQQRLPLLICVLLLSIIVTFSYISYVGVKDSALKTGKERLRSLSDQLSGMLSQSAQSTLTASRTAASQEAIKKSIQTGDPESNIESLDILRKLRSDTTWVLAELVNTNLQPVLRSSKDSLQSAGKFDSLFAASMQSDSASIGKIYQLNNAMYYSVRVPVIDNKQVIGYLVKWQKITTSEKTLESLSGLMGPHSKLYLGNRDGSLWTDMMKPVSYQQLNSSQLFEPFEYSGPEGNRIAVARPILNTAWLVSIEFPRKSVLETANRFLQWIVIIGTALIIIGIFIGWLMSRSITKPLNKLTAAASAIAGGDYSAIVAVERQDEVGKLSRAFNAMIEQVSKARQGLEQKIGETIEVNEQLRNLSAYLQNVREDERIHIAREMHDELGQLLTGFKMDVSMLRKKLIETNDPAITEKLENMVAVIDEAVNFVRNLAAELRPSILDDLGLIPALEWHSQEFEKRHKIKVEFHSEIPELNTNSVVATGLFRMYQESLTNVARHSNANKVVVNLSIIDDEIRLSITDNGKGFDTSLTSKKTLGLLGMRERAAMLGGKMDIISEPGKGTIIIIAVKQPMMEKVAVS